MFYSTFTSVHLLLARFNENDFEFVVCPDAVDLKQERSFVGIMANDVIVDIDQDSATEKNTTIKQSIKLSNCNNNRLMVLNDLVSNDGR
jgi:hypothetical protein